MGDTPEKSLKQLLLAPKTILALVAGFMLLTLGTTAFVIVFKALSTKVVGIPIGAVAVGIIALVMLTNRNRG